MNVCFLLGGFYSGGIGRVVSILANRLVDEPNLIVHAVTLRPAEKTEIYSLDSDVKRSYLITKKGSVKKILFSASRELRKYIKENDIDVVVACGNVFYPIALLAKVKKVKIICWEHSNVYNTNDNDGQTILRWLGAKLSNKIITLTECDKDGYRKKFNAKRIQRIYNPIDPQLYTESEEYNPKTKKIISVGRFCYQKHFEEIPEIAKKLNDITQDWTWDIYGNGELFDDIHQKIEKYGLENKVFLKGQVGNLYSLYKNYSMIVMTSRYEGFPMTLLEGAANGLPMLSYDILTGPNEIIDNGVNGYLIDEGNSEEMAREIASLLLNKEKRLEFSKESQKTAKRFDVNSIATEWYKMFKELNIV